MLVLSNCLKMGVIYQKDFHIIKTTKYVPEWFSHTWLIGNKYFCEISGQEKKSPLSTFFPVTLISSKKAALFYH